MKIQIKIFMMSALLLYFIFMGTGSSFLSIAKGNNEFEEHGTKNAPYLISSVDDLLYLKECVDAGEDFKDSYFVQTKNLDLAEVNWLPIGEVHSDNVFRGIYDGNGKVIYNLNITDVEYGGLFGQLDGTIMNLGIESGTIGGLCSGSIVCCGLSNAKLINCYNKANVVSVARASGIADTFDGEIYNCWSYLPADFEGFGIASNKVVIMAFCFSNSTLIGPDTYVKNEYENNLISANEYFISDNFKDALNNNLAQNTSIQYRAMILSENNKNFGITFSQNKNQSLKKIGILLKHLWWIPLIILLIFLVLIVIYINLKSHIYLNSAKKSFLVILFCIEFIFIVVLILSKGDKIDTYFVSDTHNSFMDFFNPITKNSDTTYIAPSFSNYPPMANLFFLFIKHFIPIEYWGDGQILKTSMSACLIFVLFIVTLFLLMYELIFHILNVDGRFKLNKVLSALIMLSGPFLFLYERGNNILLAVLLILFFVNYYENENKYLHELALIALALATAIKMYPVFFGILLLRKDKKKDVVKAFIYGGVTMFLPFFFYDGFETVVQFFYNVINRNSDSAYVGLGYNFSFVNGIRIIYQIVWRDYLANIPVYSIIIPAVICLVMYWFASKSWKRVLALTLLVIGIPTQSYTYNLCFMSIPLIFWLKSKFNNTSDWLYLFLFSCTFGMYAFPHIYSINNESIKYPLSWGTLLINVCLWCFPIISIIEDLCHKIYEFRCGGDAIEKN